MRIIPLTQGKCTIVSDKDYKFLSEHKWYAVRREPGPNATSGKIHMHREILGLTKGDGLCVDHRNNDGLDNRRSNLRVCTIAQNHYNRVPTGQTSKYKGVSWNLHKRKWRANICKNYVNKHLGWFNDEHLAALVRDLVALQLYGEFAYTNF